MPYQNQGRPRDVLELAIKIDNPITIDLGRVRWGLVVATRPRPPARNLGRAIRRRLMTSGQA